MLFNTAIFAAFFVAFFALYRLLPLSRPQKLLLILAGSLVFYARWDYRFVPLLLGTGLLDFTIAKRIDAAGDDERRRRLLVALSVTINLGVLAAFKYTGFLLTNAGRLLRLAGVHAELPVVELVLPVGISFYTFQSISYVVDVYRRRLRARARALEFMASLTFFPHLVAGPIIRASHLLPQFESLAPIPWATVRRGFFLVAAGLLKKTVADLLAPIADRAFTGHGALAPLGAWTSSLAFTGQIYGDFSGYTDIAIGTAALLGFHIPDNFDLPYLAASPVDFWRRWHISLSSWLRDYLYIPLGGNRTGRYRNLMITMLLGGLWHGAGWTFVAWGGYHGALLIATHALAARFPEIDARLSASKGARALKVAFTFYLTIIGWVLFRARGMGDAARVLSAMHRLRSAVPSPPITRAALLTLALTALALVVCHAVDWLVRHRPEQVLRPRVLWPAAVAALAFTIALGESGHAFIYFQF